MDTDLLRSWLGLPPGPWPPDDRTLLGLAVDDAPLPADVELRALEQMEKLRPHQIRYPDLVTEGMNRLAQAMIGLTDPARGSAPVVAASVSPPPPPPRPKARRPKPPPPPRPTGTLAGFDLDAGSLPQPAPDVLDAEVVPASPPPATPVAPRAFVSAPPPAAPPDEPEAVAELVPVPDPPVAVAEPAGVNYRPADRRKAYAELVALRRVLKAWEELQPYFGVPSEPLATPAAVFGFLRAVRGCAAELRRAGGVDWFDRHGAASAAVVRNPLALSVFRELVANQRQLLAADWAAALAGLRSRLAAMRAGLRRSKPRRRLAVLLRDTRVWLRQNPEWMLGLAVFVALAVAVLRTAMRSAAGER
jgi:hypothetical protein